MLDDALNNLIKHKQPYNLEFKIKTRDTGEIKDIHSIAQYDKRRINSFRCYPGYYFPQANRKYIACKRRAVSFNIQEQSHSGFTYYTQWQNTCGQS